ncbi:MAG TPA: ABC transporter ATP-binding protein [Solirubrobacteraceae bacterium]|nr:ABC transporter ATP-binding protein [Solirubrobacteraceae bacterium]
MSDAPILSASGVTKRFGARVALHEVSFEVRSGELVALIGPNGACKTTLLSVLAGVQAASAGSVGGQGGKVGWVPQQPAVYTKLTVAENLALWAHLERVADTQDTVRRMLEQTGLTKRADEQVGRLSGGNRQRVNIAVGMLSRPAALLLDEPSAALDPIQRGRLWEFVRGLSANGTSVVFSTHNVAEAERYAGRVLVLDEGRLLLDGSPQTLLREVTGRSEAADGVDFEEAFVAFLRRSRV